MAFYSRQHYKLVCSKENTKEQAAELERRRKVGAQAIADRIAKFPVLTAENAAEAIAFQERRIKELLGQ
jgi:hypothetical protein